MLLTMSGSSMWGQTPRQSVEHLCTSRGETAVVSGCVALLEGAPADVDIELVVALGGPPARWALTGEPPGPDYWLRVWATRGLLYVWRDEAVPAVLIALGDEAWRVREMAAKVVARRRLDNALEPVADLQADENARVRAAASRALIALAKSGGKADQPVGGTLYAARLNSQSDSARVRTGIVARRASGAVTYWCIWRCTTCATRQSRWSGGCGFLGDLALLICIDRP